jgi:UDP-3-O-[3-hydroxymyristoyl] N-acetylglucosamine deacetylase
VSTQVRGPGLFSGGDCSVVLTARPGPVTLARAGCELLLSEFTFAPGLQSSNITHPHFGELATVEHLFAAFAGLNLYEGVGIELAGDEVPCAGGNALAFVEALAQLELHESLPSLKVARAASLAVEGAVYTFAPSANRLLEVEFVTEDPRLSRCVFWDGTSECFRSKIASARTFAFAADLQRYVERGMRTFLAPADAVVIGETILRAGAPFRADEPACHKLLDLLGDMFLYGGPPIGHIVAVAPGHKKTHAAMAQAIREGILEGVP